MDQAETLWYCVDCGVRLKTDHDYCWNCGTRRWAPPAAGLEPAPVGTPAVVRPPAARARPETAPGLGGLMFFFGFWGVLLLVWATYSAAQLTAPLGRAALVASQPGVSGDEIVTVRVIAIAAAVLMAGLHAAAYYGIRRLRAGGWLVAVVVAGLWSLVLVGVPALYVLLQRSTREVFGLV